MMKFKIESVVKGLFLFQRKLGLICSEVVFVMVIVVLFWIFVGCIDKKSINMREIQFFIVGWVERCIDCNVFFLLIEVCYNDGNLSFQGDVVEFRFQFVYLVLCIFRSYVYGKGFFFIEDIYYCIYIVGIVIVVYRVVIQLVEKLV